MNPTTWHPAPKALELYATGRPSAALAASVEAHVVECPTCRRTLAPYADTPLVERGRDGLRTTLAHRRRPRLVRLAERLGLSDGDAVLLTASRAMADAWLGSLLVVLAVATIADLFTGVLGRTVFVLGAPVVPVLGVAVVYLNTEPTLEELARSTPYSSLRLVLVRTVAVLVTAVPLCLLGGLAMGNLGGLLFAWLLPALALTAMVLALSTWAGIELVAGAVALGWALLVGSLTISHDPISLVAAQVQPLHLALALGAMATMVARLRLGHVPGGAA